MWLLGGLVVAGLVGPGLAHAGEKVAQALVDSARTKGAVNVIVELSVSDPSRGGPVRLPSLSTAGRQAIASTRSSVVRRLGGVGFSLRRQYETLPLVSAQVTEAGLAALGRDPDVESVVEDRLESLQLSESGPIVGAPEAWSLGYDGSGWAVAILDTGVDRNHEFLAGKVVDEACFTGGGGCPNGADTQYGVGAAAPCAWAPQTCAHGTHVAGVAAGRGQQASGVARGASILAIQVFSRFQGGDCDGEREDPCAKSYTSDVIAALEWIYQLRDTHRIASANLSLGGGQFFSQAACDLYRDEQPRRQIIEALRGVGIATVAASGNSSWDDSMSTPACLSAVVSVGATSKSDQVASFSNSASFLSFLAPGVSIVSSIPGNAYGVASGTSQATPHVAGAFAVLYQRLGSARLDDALAALQATGLPVFDGRNALTKPRIQIDAAIASFGTPGAASGLQITPDTKHTLISKDVNGERWAIATSEGGDTVTGNVFRPEGGDPVFVYCERTGSDGNPNPYEERIDFDCSVSGNCTSLSCPTDQWTFLSSVTLSGSFLLPPASGSSASTSPGSGAPVAGGSVSSALQITPDLAQTLVSKDVGGERWAIARNADDSSVTGNVYPIDGGEPKFVWCALLRTDGNPDPSVEQLTYGCSVADRCAGPTCSPASWNFFSEVTLPGSFFLPR